MLRLKLLFLLSTAVSVFPVVVGCDSSVSTSRGTTPAETPKSVNTSVSETTTSNAETPPNPADMASPAPKPTTVASILFGECSAPEKLEGWQIVNELDCQCAWPLDEEFSKFAIYPGRGDEPVFSFEAGPRNENFTLDQIMTATKKKTTMGMSVTESKELNVGDGVRCLAYAGEDRTNRQLFRVYLTESQLWMISASYPKKNDFHPTLNYFFKNFQVTVGE